MKRNSIPAVFALLLLAALTLVGCSGPQQQTRSGSDTETPPPAEQPTSGLRLAPGLYELEGGTVQALGTLNYRATAEGGYWYLTGEPGREDDTIVAFVDSDEFNRRLEPLKGKQILVTGRKPEGPSTLNAGPEMIVEKVEEITDTPGVAE